MVTTAIIGATTSESTASSSSSLSCKRRGISFESKSKTFNVLSVKSLFLLINDYLRPTETVGSLANSCHTFKQFVTPQLLYRQLKLNLKAFSDEAALAKIEHFIKNPEVIWFFGLSRVQYKHAFFQLEKLICGKENLITRVVKGQGSKGLIDELLAVGVSPDYTTLYHVYFSSELPPEIFRNLMTHYPTQKEEELNDLLDNCLLNIGSEPLEGWNTGEGMYSNRISMLEGFLEKGIMPSQDCITSIRSTCIPYMPASIVQKLEDRIFARSPTTRTTSKWLSDASIERIQGRDSVALPPLVFKGQTPFIKKLQIDQNHSVEFSKGHIFVYQANKYLAVYDQTSAHLKWNVKLRKNMEFLDTPQGILVYELQSRKAWMLDIHTGKATSVILPGLKFGWGDLIHCTPRGMYYQTMKLNETKDILICGFKFGEEGRPLPVFVNQIDERLVFRTTYGEYLCCRDSEWGATTTIFSDKGEKIILSGIYAIAVHGNFIYIGFEKPNDVEQPNIKEFSLTNFSSTPITHQREFSLPFSFTTENKISVLDDGTLVIVRKGYRCPYEISLLHDMRKLLTIPEKPDKGEFYVDVKGNAVWILKEREIWKYTCSEGILISQHMGNISHPAHSFYVVDGVFYHRDFEWEAGFFLKFSGYGR